MSGSADEFSAAARIEAYLRNELTNDDRAAFERDLLRDQALRARVDIERQIDDRLCTMYSVPATPDMATARAAGPAPRTWVRVALGMAAMFVLATGVHFSGIFGPGPGDTKADAVLARLQRTGFEPAWACKDDAEFVQYTRDKFGQPFTVAKAEGVHVVGWTYCSGVLGDEAGVMMVELDDTEQAIVVVDRRANDRPVEVEPASGLKVHRLKVGSAVLYEISKRDQAVILPLVHSAD